MKKNQKNTTKIEIVKNDNEQNMLNSDNNLNTLVGSNDNEVKNNELIDEKTVDNNNEQIDNNSAVANNGQSVDEETVNIDTNGNLLENSLEPATNTEEIVNVVKDEISKLEAKEDKIKQKYTDEQKKLFNRLFTNYWNGHTSGWE